ncbi:DUF1990 family protein [Actinomadura scrupuli]|uniref:DUF1990 family protein n=1 Tax=Actinomadura scrupuli TaxID=559629 RepID=UPI003D95EB35
MKLTYDEVGATRDGSLPDGYRRLRERTLLGQGPAVMAAATDAVLDWWMHRAAGVRIDSGGRRAAPGVIVTVRLGVGPLALRAPCEIIWTEEGDRRAGFGYGTLSGHPASGEEAFVVSRDAEDDVWLTVTAFSRPAVWYTRAGGPLVPVMQRAYARRCGTALRRLVSAADRPGA